MRKTLFLGVGIFCLTALLFVSATSTDAHHKGRVLAETSETSNIDFPAVTSGPGLILPDSPLFFIDQVFQSVRLTLATEKQAKARVRAQIAGERLAELRVMLSRNNPRGIDVALSQLNEQNAAAASALTDASAQGKDVSLLAKELNETIKLHRKILGTLANQTNGDLRLRIKATREALKNSKIEVEDELEDEELEHEIEEALEEEIENEVGEAEESAKKVEKLLIKLEEEASRSASKAFRRREEAIRRAIEARNEALREAEEEAREIEEKKREELEEAREKAAEAALRATKEAQKAAEELRKFQERVSEIKSNGFDNSGSGSSGSESDDDKD